MLHLLMKCFSRKDGQDQIGLRPIANPQRIGPRAVLSLAIKKSSMVRPTRGKTGVIFFRFFFFKRFIEVVVQLAFLFNLVPSNPFTNNLRNIGGDN